MAAEELIKLKAQAHAPLKFNYSRHCTQHL